MHTGVCSTALHQNVVAVSRPRMCQRGLNHGFAVTAAPQLRVSDNILQKAVAFSSAKQVRRGDEHAGRGDAIMIVGHEDAGHPRLCQDFLPDAFGTLGRLRDGTHLRHVKEGEERGQIGKGERNEPWPILLLINLLSRIKPAGPDYL